MTDEQSLSVIKQALEKTLNREVEFDSETNLLTEGIIDSLDGIKFLFEVENLAGIKLPDSEVVQNELFNVAHLMSYLSKTESPSLV